MMALFPVINSLKLDAHQRSHAGERWAQLAGFNFISVVCLIKAGYHLVPSGTKCLH